MNNDELKSQFYDWAREYLDEHCPDFDRHYGEEEAHNAHVALVNLFVWAYLNGKNR